MKVFHVTHTKNVGAILKKGIVPFKTSNWQRASGGRYGGPGEIFAFEDKRDAIRWAAKMAWDFYQDSVSPKISIVTIDSPEAWEAEYVDPISQATAKGKWLKRIGAIGANYIMQVEPLSREMVKSLQEERMKTFRQLREVVAGMMRASIVHNDDDWRNPNARRVPLFYDQDANAWVNHETNEIIFHVPPEMTPEEAIRATYGTREWDLKVAYQGGAPK